MHYRRNYLREIRADDIRHRGDVGLEAVDGVAGVMLFAAEPAGADYIREQARTDDEIHPGIGEILKPGVVGGDYEAEDYHDEYQRRVEGQTARRNPRRDIYQLLAEEDEIEVEPDIDNSEEYVPEQGPADAFRASPQPAEVF